MNPTLIQDLLARDARRRLALAQSQGMDQDRDQSMDRALGAAMAHMLRQGLPGLSHAERFCFRALVRGAGNRMRRCARAIPPA